MIKIFFLSIVFMAFMAGAKAPANPDFFTCPQKSKKTEAKKPTLLHEVNEKLVLGVCGTKEPENGNYSDFDVYVFPDVKKPVFSNHTKNRKVLVIDKKNGFLFIEKVKIGENYVELFKNELNCGDETCKLEKEVCAVFKKDRLSSIYKTVKDKKVKSKMKKLGCI